MFKHLKDYIRPGAAHPSNGGAIEAVNTTPSQPLAPITPNRFNFQSGSTSAQRVSQMRADISLEWMARTQEANLWISSPPVPGEGAILKIGPGAFISKPRTLKEHNHPFYQAAVSINVKVCLFLTDVVEAAKISKHYDRS